MSGDFFVFAVVIVLVLGASVFACADAALGHISHNRSEELFRDGRRGAAALRSVVSEPSRYLNLLLLLRLACEIGASALVMLEAVHAFRPTDGQLGNAGDDWSAFGVTIGVMLVVSYVVVGVSPRTIGLQHAESVGLATAGLARGLDRIFGPLPRLLIVLGNALTPGKGFREGPFTTEADLRDLVDLASEHKLIESGEREMIHSVFELSDTIVREVMVPRTDMVYVERDKTVRQALSLALRSGFSRIPVIGANADDVIGVVYLRDMARRYFDNRDDTDKVETVLRSPTFVPDSKPVDELLREMQTKQIHLAIVIDEYGGTAGLITIEDILEEIVGDIADEYDREKPRVEVLDDGQMRVSVRMSVDDIEEIFDVELPQEDVETVGGLLAAHLGRVPIPGATVELEGLRFVAESAAGRRNKIGTVLISKLAPFVATSDSPATDTDVQESLDA
ncbi:MAG: magnesium and cobalt exporter, family [Frankiaceae bacterium]|jgi:CBS domain containing-hemolysin-like protein|nr:magnesium and cobalt exporter, family [Frankiaceae bacterium]MDQ1724388.1 magnesium and cobalt exporter, family [Frankiaceae bacterium]